MENPNILLRKEGAVTRIILDNPARLNAISMAIAANAPLTVRAVKRITAELRRDPNERDMALCEALVAECYASVDHQESRLAFAQKRQPVFMGR